MKAEKTQKESSSRTLQSKPDRGRVYMEDNRSEMMRQAKGMYEIQLKEKNKILQRQIHLVDGLNATGFPPDSNSHAYYCIADNAGDTILFSESYASCVGLSIYRAAQKETPARGMIVHFWAGGSTSDIRLANFTADVQGVLTAWGEVLPTDMFTIWSGTKPEHPLSIERMKAFPKLLPKLPQIRAHTSGKAYLHLNTGAVTP